MFRRERVPRGPIVFDFINDRVYRAKYRPRSIVDAVSPRKRRVIKRVEGLPPQAIQPKS
jgi:hypothetical protein